MNKKTDFLKKIQDDGIVLWGAYYLFDILREVSVFQQIRRLSAWRWKAKFKKEHPKATPLEQASAWEEKKPFTHCYIFPELWALSHILLAFLGCLIMAKYECVVIKYCLLFYGIARMFELFVYQVNVLLFDPIKSRLKRHTYRIKSATRTILLLICNIIEYVLWFSVVYIFIFRQSYQDVDGFRIILESVTTLANIASPEDISKYEDFMEIAIIAYVESVVGVFLNIICLARFISLLPSVETVDKA